MTTLARSVRPAHPSWRRDDIQGLRAVAVLMVVAFHSGVNIPGGYIGVDMFFVVSGFVITQLILRNHASRGGFHLRTFYARRMKRLLPALALLTTVVLIAAIFLESPFGAQRTTATTALGASFFVANFVIYANTGGYFDAPAEVNPLLHTWSLSVEEQFYFVFPSLMAFAWWRATRRNAAGGHHANGRRIAATLLGALAVVSFVLSLGMTFEWFTLPGVDKPASWAYYSSFTRAWEFAVGALLAMALAHWPNRITLRRGQLLTVLGAILILVSMFGLTASTPFPGWIAWVPVGGTALLIAGGTTSDAATAPHITRALALPGLAWIGALSYSWYLWHWPVIVYTRTLWGNDATILLIAGLASLLPAWLSYRYVENPLRLNPRITGRKVIGLLATVIAVPTLVAVAVISGAAHYWGSPQIQSMAQQIEPLPVSYANGCDSGTPIGQQSDLDCTWNAHAPGAPITLVGDSEAGQLAEATIGAGEQLGRPVTIADMNSCPFLLPAVDGPPVSEPDCAAFVERTVAALASEPAGTVVIGMSPNYLTEDTRGDVQSALTRSVTALQDSGHEVVLLAPIPQFFGWGTWDCSIVHMATSADGCGAVVPRDIMDNRQMLALDTFTAVAQQTGAALLDIRGDLCSTSTCATNVGDMWQYRDMFHLTVGQSTRLIPVMAKALSTPG